ncbi:LPXTG cell wall anchor domain-containing protein [Streptomyces nigra]
MMSMRTGRLAVLAALPAAALLTVAGSSTAIAGEDTPAYQIDLEQLNDSGSKGTVMLSARGQELTVWIKSEGMVPGQPSAQHLHGSTEGHDFVCPDDSADEDGDGILNNTEATVHYGDINIALTVSGDTDAATSGLAVDRMPVADKEGKITYKRTLQVSQDVIDHIKDLHVVQHGIDPNNNDKYDFEGAGKSELDPKLPQEATAPTNCGEVKGAAIGSVPVGGIETGSGATGTNMTSGTAIGAASAAAMAVAAFVVVRRRKTSGAAAAKAGDAA